MNELIQSLLDRKSVRAFEDTLISPEDKLLILKAAAAAPSAGGQQLYTILDITDQALKDWLAITCDNQPFIAKAPLVLIFCADARKWYDAYEFAGCHPRTPGAGDLLLAVSDANIAAQNAVTAAWSLGIGSCYIGDIMEQCETHRDLLHLPLWVFPAVMLVFGYPTISQLERQKPGRCGLEHIVHENGYHKMDEPQLRQLLCGKNGEQDYETWLHAFCKRKYNSDFSIEMSRSVAEYLEDFLPEKAKLKSEKKILPKKIEEEKPSLPQITPTIPLLQVTMPLLPKTVDLVSVPQNTKPVTQATQAPTSLPPAAAGLESVIETGMVYVIKEDEGTPPAFIESENRTGTAQTAAQAAESFSAFFSKPNSSE